MPRRSRFTGSWAFAAAICATAATAQVSGQLCHRDGDRFFGEPFSIQYAVLLDPEPFENLLFPNASVRVDSKPSCIGNGLTGRIKCVGEDLSAGAHVPLGDVGLGLAEIGGRGKDTIPRMVALTLLMRPVFAPGNPPSITLEEVGTPDVTSPADLSESEANQASEALKAQIAAIGGWRQEITLAEMDPILDGDRPALSLPIADGRVQSRGLPPELWLAMECGSLFADMTNQAILEDKRAAVADELADLRQRLRTEVANGGWRGYFFDSSYVDQIQKRIGYLERQQADLDRRIGEKSENIARRTRVLSEEDRAREMAAIKADPERLATEQARRRDEMIAAARETARYQMRLVEGEKVYARKLAALDAMIGDADARGANALSNQLRSDRDRLATARDQWRHSANGMYGVRLADEARLKAENAKDGIGPTTHASQMLRAEGKDLEEILFAGAREDARRAVTRQAMYDAASLGGSATDTYTAEDFIRHLGESNAEYANDPLLFLERYNAYAEGVEQVVIDEVADIVATGKTAAAIAGQVFESTLEDATGIKLDVAGDSDLRAGAEALTALSNASVYDLGDAVDRVAQSFGDQIESAARRGEEGLRDALSATGYVAGSILLPDADIKGYVTAGRAPGKRSVASRAPELDVSAKPNRPPRERVVLTAPPGTSAPRPGPKPAQELNVLAEPGLPIPSLPAATRSPPTGSLPAWRPDTNSPGLVGGAPREPVRLNGPSPSAPSNAPISNPPRERVTLTAPQPRATEAPTPKRPPREKVTLTAPEPRASQPASPTRLPQQDRLAATTPGASDSTIPSGPSTGQRLKAQDIVPDGSLGPRAPTRTKYIAGGVLAAAHGFVVDGSPGARQFARIIEDETDIRRMLRVEGGASGLSLEDKLRNMGYTIEPRTRPFSAPPSAPEFP